MEYKRCYIVGAGEFDDCSLPEESDFIIAADAGFFHLYKHDIRPNLIVGDFDSLPSELEPIVNSHPNVISVSSIKDDTDMLLAVREGLKLGFDSFLLNGALGGNIQHTYANFQVLIFLANEGAVCTLLGSSSRATAITDGTVEFNSFENSGKTISVFSAGEKADGVTLEGLEYPLTNASLTNSFPIGTSNKFTDKPAKITVKKGTLLIIW